eukprot:g187.t1
MRIALIFAACAVCAGAAAADETFNAEENRAFAELNILDAKHEAEAASHEVQEKKQALLEAQQELDQAEVDLETKGEVLQVSGGVAANTVAQIDTISKLLSVGMQPIHEDVIEDIGGEPDRVDAFSADIAEDELFANAEVPEWEWEARQEPPEGVDRDTAIQLDVEESFNNYVTQKSILQERVQGPTEHGALSWARAAVAEGGVRPLHTVAGKGAASLLQRRTKKGEG